MATFHGLNSLWDLSQASAFSQLPDDDFLALLQKQFASSVNDPNAPLDTGVDPQSIQQLPLPNLTPPSEDSSPSPSSINNGSLSRRQSAHFRANDNDDARLKRKASDDDDMGEGPSSKNQHIDNMTASKKGSIGPARRKSTGNSQDESRLLKRKEQNRAAQRAFRERKEKHVKDLEDKVAALEAKNEQAQSENENLKDLLSRLQNENLALKNAAFTFSVPKPGESSNPQSSSPGSSSGISQSPFNNLFSSNASSASPPAIPPQQTSSPKPMSFGDVDWNSLTTFDPSMLNLLDDNSQQTATDAMQMDLSGQYSLPPPTHYKTLATNPLFMSFADVDGPNNDTNPNNNNNPFNFSFQSNNPWSPQSQREAPSHEHSLDELFGGNYLGNQGPLDFNALLKSPSGLSPISHGVNGNSNGNGHSPMSQITMSSPSLTNNGHSPFSWTMSSRADETPPSAPSSDSDRPYSHSNANGNANGAVSDSSRSHSHSHLHSHPHSNPPCTISKADLAKQIEAEGDSPFTNAAPPPALRKASDSFQGNMIACKGANFPMTEENDHNIEVLSAWRRITSDPQYKVRFHFPFAFVSPLFSFITIPKADDDDRSFQDVDINHLCSEFTNKAKCDGTKVVLEPQGVHHIMESLLSKQPRQS
ncbi:hypothetical protein SERLA73DRAFT_78019 [Serpula lacrymans var. lacrymans S7.3]|uniref:BZIP domain-containing protein n=2 Tax=Serpula lacrymans var. lacrymans TaxID=341189 RepID=F8QBX1_SERL3|nr:uncharacterized protein SERLADRAFT_442978 [Serpula lacrymans var. lacrymans S7.9]EGN94090.1 hypothetical protein SERLA73DRAFT_78019 [Serpula lacrymans var. lacrymans S7.3]EGO19503.1 hypothetical protein SERLADRAFT_442978 [Serpula lacrymans var. lacrymans S7.9]